MQSTPRLKAALLTAALSFALVGCSGGSDEMSQEEIQYLSHVDQARFFQQQGELKASTLEARNAIELQPGRLAPYLVIIDNLLTAGDARSAERQLNELLAKENLGVDDQSQAKIGLIRARANFMQQNYNEGLAALESITNPDRAQDMEARILRGDIHFAAGNPDQAQAAYENARELDPNSALPLIGLSRIAYAANNRDQAIAYIDQAEEVDPQNEELWLWKGRLAHTENRWAEAEQAYISALETIGQYDIMTYQKYETMSALIDVLRQQGKSAEAFVYEEILAKSAPGTIRSNLVAAQEAFQEGDLSVAARYLEEVLNQSPGNETAATMLGIIRFRQGRAEDAEKLLAPVAEMNQSMEATRLLAAARLQQRDLEGAKELFTDIDENEADPSTLALVGIASLASGEIETGERLIERSLELNEQNNQLRLRYANYHISQGNTDRAIALSQEAISLDPESGGGRQMLIRAHIAAGDLPSATAVAEDWVEEMPTNEQALVVRGNVALQANDPEQAEQYFQRAREAAPDSPVPLVTLGRLEQSRENTQAAQAYFIEAVKLAPDNRPALQGLTSVMPREELNPLMGELRDQQPDAIGPRLVLLETALVDGDRTLADELTAGLIEREEPDTPAPAEELVSNIYNNTATQLARRGQSDEASEILQRGRILFPENENIGLQAATLQFAEGNATAARDILSDVKQASPDSPAPFLVEARFMERNGQPAQAAELYQLALEKNPDNPGLMMSLASAHQSANQQAQAEELYQRIISMQPDNAAALNNLAWMYQEQGNPEAMELARRAYELAPQSAAVADTYGWILLNNGEEAESVTILEQAHELAPESREIATHLARAYEATGNPEKARELLDSLPE
jgi:putative PEP-CTERM system TPR-repeat lipoprotein